MENPLFYTCRKYIFRISCVLALAALTACNKSQNLKPDHTALLKKISDSAYSLFYKHKANAAHRLFNDTYAAIKEPGIGDQITYYKFKQRIYFQSFLWDYDKMNLPFILTYPDSILQLIEKNKVEKLYQVQYIDAQITKGDILYAMRNFGQAYYYYFTAKTLTDKLDDQYAKANFNHGLGTIIYKEGKFKKAASIFMQEYNQRILFKFSTDNFGPTQEAINNAGLCYMELGMVDSAIYCFKKANAYIDENEGKFLLHKRFVVDARGVTNGFLGFAYYSIGDNTKAEELLKKGIKSNSRGGTEGKDCQLMQLNLARLYLTTGRKKQADSMANEIKLSLDTLPNKEAELQWKKLKIDYYNLAGEPAKAQAFWPGYLQLKHKADLMMHTVIENDVDNYFSNMQKSYDQKLLKKQKQLTYLQLTLFIGVTLFILFIVFQLWNNWRTAKKHNAELTDINRQTNDLNSSLQNTLNVLKLSQEENMRVLQIVAHDLRNPVTSMYSITSIVLKSAALSADDRSMLETVKMSGKNCLDMVNDLLTVNIKPGDHKKEMVELAEMLSYCVEQLSNKAEEKGQQITLQANPCAVPGEPEKLWRVVSNLLGNAIKFSPRGSVINVTLQENDKNVVIGIKDHGIGIPDELKDKIFTMAADSMRPGTAGEQPFGMGLSISKQIIEAHSGKLWFESEPGKGTIFYIELLK